MMDNTYETKAMTPKYEKKEFVRAIHPKGHQYSIVGMNEVFLNTYNFKSFDEARKEGWEFS